MVRRRITGELAGHGRRSPSGLVATAAAALLLPLGMGGAAAASVEPEPERVTVAPEQVSVGMYSLVPWVEDAGIESVLDRLSTIGFRNFEPYGGWAPGTFEGYTAEEFRALADDYDLSIPSSHYNNDEDTFDETLEFASTLGQRWVGSGGFPGPGIDSYEDTLETAAVMNRLGAASVENGTGKFFGHNHADEFTTVYEHEGVEMSAWEIIAAETNPEHVTFQLDVAWAADGGVDVPALIEQYEDRIELLHVKDATDLGEEDGPTFTNLGEGDMPLQEILRAADDAGVELYVMEWDLAPNGDDFVTTGFEYLTGLPAGEEPEPEPVAVAPEQVSVGMYSLVPWVEDAGIESVLDRLSTIGFQNFEPYGGWAPGTFEGYTAEEFRALADDYGLSIPSSHYDVDEDTFDETLEFVSTLGQQWVGSGGFPDPGLDSYEDTLATAERMNRLGERSVENGTGKLFGHNHDGEFTAVYEHNGVEMSAWEILVDQTDPEYVTFQLDIAWAAHGGVDVVELIEQYGDRIELLHVKDGTDIGAEDGPTFTNLGEGDMPLQHILRAADDAGVELYVMEWDLAPNGDDFVTTGFEYLTGLPAGEEPEPEPTTPTVPSPEPSDTDGQGPGPVRPGGGSLANTGVDALGFAALAALLVATGAGAALVKRRHSTT